MHASVAKVPIERTTVMKSLHQATQVAQISSKSFGSDDRIFEAFPFQRFAGNVRSDAEARLADLPDAPGLFVIGEQVHVRRRRGTVERLHKMTSLRFGFGYGVCSELHHQPATAFWQHRKAFEVNAFATARADHDVVEAFEAYGTMLHNQRNMIGADINVGPSDLQQYPLRRTLDEATGSFKNGDASSFGADER